MLSGTIGTKESVLAILFLSVRTSPKLYTQKQWKDIRHKYVTEA
jgi:hypothetical protein